MEKETYFELTKLSVPIIKNEIVRMSWRNSVITVHTAKHVNFFEYSYNLNCLERKLDFVEYSINSLKSSPATEVCNANFMKSEMRNIDYTEMIVNSSFWPHNQALTEEMASVSTCKWSPQNYLKNQCVLAVLNNIGGVEFFGQQRSQWKSVLNLSPHITKALNYNKSPASFEKLKESVYAVETSAICWASGLNSDNSCYFVTAQKNGSILFWQICHKLDEVKLKGCITVEMSDIIEMKWIPKSENNFFIVCSDVLGQIKAVDFKIENENINFQQSVALWPHTDRMMPVNIKYTIIDDKIILICSKHRHLLIQVLDDNANVLSQYLNNVNDYRITDITYTSEGIYVSTVNVKLYKVNINLENDSLNVDLIQINIKETYPTYELHGVRFSTNNVVCALAMVDRKVLCRKEAHKTEIIFISTNPKLKTTVPILRNNPSRKLTNYWDCLELFRFQMAKLKMIPKIDFNELYTSASNDLYLLKMYYLFMTYITSLKSALRITYDVDLPETSADVVKEKILYLHAVVVGQKLRDKLQNDGCLSEVEKESLYRCKIYIDYYAKKHKTEVTYNDTVLNAVTNIPEYVCQCCDDKIEGFTCRSNHLNMLCMVSLTLITNEDYLFCKCCGSTARADLEVECPECVFCDLYLIKPD